MPVFKSRSHLSHPLRPHLNLIDELAGDLVPVRRLWPPALRAAFWLGVVVAFAFGLFLTFDITNMVIRFDHVPEARAAMAGSVTAVVLGALAVFHLGLPDRSPVWVLLPVPGLALWVAATASSNLRRLAVPGTHWYGLREAPRSFLEVIALSLPLTALLIFMLRRAYSLYPTLTSLCGGFTVAAATVSLFYISHPYDKAGSDILVLLLALGIVVTVTYWLVRHFLNR